MANFLKSQHFKYGFPFIIAIVGGAYGLQFYTQLRYDVQAEKRLISKTKAISELSPNPMQRPVTIEEVYEEYKQTVDLDNWKNIRGPRPWEGDNTEYKEVIERRASESKNRWIFKDA